MRPLLSYDDITDTQAISTQSPGFQASHNSSSQSRKRKRNNNQKSLNLNNKRRCGTQPTRYPQHWDDPGTSFEPVVYDEPGNEEYFEDEETELGVEESRELTQDEIWDDSALIDAWDAATEEYERFHGPEKNWKEELVHKSALWYNVPLSPSRLQSTITTVPSAPEKRTEFPPEAEQNSQPIDFDSFVPIHDPSLSQLFPDKMDANAAPTAASSLSNVTPDEAFSKALNAMYWTGYWTAVYHCGKKSSEPTGNLINENTPQTMSDGIETIDDAQPEDEDLIVGDDLVASQR